MSEAAMRFREAAVDRVLHGPATTSDQARRAAYENRDVEPAAAALIDKIANTAWKITDEDVAAAKAAGLAEDAIFELAVAAAMGQATRQLDAALDALETSLREDR